MVADCGSPDTLRPFRRNCLSHKVAPMPWRYRLLLLGMSSIPALSGCERPVDQLQGSHPPELVGRWTRQLDEGASSDTLHLKADGTISGSATNPVPASARWSIRADAAGRRLFCAADSAEGSCQRFELRQDILIVGLGPERTMFHRVP